MPVDDVRPYRLHVPQKAVDDLHDRLGRVRWPDELPDAGWSYGIPLEYLRELAHHWRTAYDWRVHEARINAMPQTITTIDGTAVHAIHVRSPEPDALPLVLTHGWPGSVVEFLDVVGPLADPRSHGGDPRDAFHVVVPSIPGFGLSGPTSEKGWNVERIARAWAELMRRLGYEQYGAQGGDWGSRISWQLGLTAPEHVIGVHVNMLVPDVEGATGIDLTRPEQDRLDRLAHMQSELAGYMRLQATRPQTLAYALTDSPVGQLAWIAERFMDWTDAAVAPEDAVDRDHMLTDVSLYWFTGTAGSAARIYYEHVHGGGSFGPPPPTTVPTGVAVFAADTVLPIRRLAERTNTIVHWSEFDRGGHFAAMEEPDLLVSDVRAFFRRFR
ncbi:MAG: epoxide hydrolase [Pseudonocardia sp. SCN 72-86]|nr:MAG: epoxide hydrolase [Pseudonocardia sp. SCN 72-86]